MSTSQNLELREFLLDFFFNPIPESTKTYSLEEILEAAGRHLSLPYGPQQPKPGVTVNAGPAAHKISAITKLAIKGMLEQLADEGLVVVTKRPMAKEYDPMLQMPDDPEYMITQDCVDRYSETQAKK